MYVFHICIFVSVIRLIYLMYAQWVVAPSNTRQINLPIVSPMVVSASNSTTTSSSSMPSSNTNSFSGSISTSTTSSRSIYIARCSDTSSNKNISNTNTRCTSSGSGSSGTSCFSSSSIRSATGSNCSRSIASGSTSTSTSTITSINCFRNDGSKRNKDGDVTCNPNHGSRGGFITVSRNPSTAPSVPVSQSVISFCGAESKPMDANDRFQLRQFTVDLKYQTFCADARVRKNDIEREHALRHKRAHSYEPMVISKLVGLPRPVPFSSKMCTREVSIANLSSRLK